MTLLSSEVWSQNMGHPLSNPRTSTDPIESRGDQPCRDETADRVEQEVDRGCLLKSVAGRAGCSASGAQSNITLKLTVPLVTRLAEPSLAPNPEPSAAQAHY